ncbi:penicillin-binding transpeptidase domain-containing protein [Ruminococcus sp.]|uniref:penicillin-binding transpeptidase domain-containing protein n=1 Tax=Ruminococcus sp. TaxID=41978 RepID=UPI0025D4B3AE|nr:penicillin-binding transpeptidase domain-containing protein [Ruminococcus sp.]MCI6615631.1 penicillin-binding protein [Ruminococcus sp.]
MDFIKRRKKRESKNKYPKTTITVCIIITLGFFVLFTARLVDWQIVHGSEYRELAKRSTSYTVRTDATRGEILDKNGDGIVVNTTHYKIVIDKLYANEETLDTNLLALINLMNLTGDKWEDTLPIELSGNTLSYKKGAEDEIATLLSEDYLNLDENTTAQDCFTKLLERYKIDEKLTLTEQRNLVSVHYNMELTGYSSSNPYVFAKDIKRSTVSAVSENTQGVSGIDVQTYLVRKAQDSDLAPHILGALGSITEEEYEKLKDGNKTYSLTDSVGKFGIELAFENQLKGEGGMKIIKRNSDGTIVDTIETIDSKPGNTVYLTLDKKLQETAVKSLAENVKAAKVQGVATKESYGGSGWGEDCETGAVVMLSVKDFSVLAAASYPTYDLNKYSQYGDYYVKLSENKNSPMYNRISVGSFACGSVYKPCVACAALEEKTITKDTEIFCKQEYDYYPSNVVHCMHYHGDENVTGAIAQSCNYFFAETGRRLGIETMYLYSEKFGLGEYTGIEIEESKGTLAGRDSTSWMPGNTVQAAIGQSDNAFTPLQLATYAATLANDGTRLKTHVVSKVTDYERTKTIEDYSKATVVDTCGISKKNLDIVQKAMLEVTQDEDGTAYSMFGDYKVKVAAKTGTAENAGSDHTTFICYAPFDKPEVAVAVVIEHGAKGRYSMQVAKDLLDGYFK